MALNKLENQIKEKLNSREIQPSAQAWDRLDAMLTVAEEKKTKPSFGWLYIAASVLVLVSLGMFFFTQNGTQIQPQNTVVETEIKNDTIKQDENSIPTPIIDNQSKSNQNNQVAVNQFQSSPEAQPNRLERNGKNQKSNNNQIINEKQNQIQNQAVAENEAPKTDERKPTVNRVNTLSDEQLLASLDNSASKSANQKSTVSVDAKKLLSEVDGEVEYTFREKVINKISKNYKEVKVALANRNKE